MSCCKKRRATTTNDIENSKPNVDLEQYKKDMIDLKNEKLSIERPVYTQRTFDVENERGQFGGFNPLRVIRETATQMCTFDKKCAKKQLYNRLPCIKWIRDYRFGEYLGADIIAGLTVGVLYIPQGLAYALLAQCPPINGLYTCFFPVLIYWIFGTSRHCSINTTSVAALLVGNTVLSLSDKYVPKTSGMNITGTDFLSSDRDEARVIIATSQAFWIGIFHLIMWICQFSFVSDYLSEPFTKGFSAGCAIHVLTAQLKYLFGLKLTGYKGAFKVIKTWINLFDNLPKTNIGALVISIICIIFLSIVKYGINQRFAHKLPFPIPAELFIVIFGTIGSTYGNFETLYKVDVVGVIKEGLPGPVVPQLWLIKDMIVDCIILAVITYTTNFSLGDVYAKKHKYKINARQELFAAGVSNIFGSFFSCFTAGASFATSGVQDSAGGKTQVVAWLATSVLLVVFLKIGPVFRVLPHACLAAVIVVSLKNLIFQLEHLKSYWKTNKLEFVQMLLTFLCIVILDVDLGLAIGIGYYIIINLLRTQAPNSALLGNVPGTEIYKDVKLYKNAKEIDGIKIVRIEESLHYTNSSGFKSKIFEFTRVKPQEYMIKRNKIDRARERKKLAELHIILRITPQSIQKRFPNYFAQFKKSVARKENFEKSPNQQGLDNPVFKSFAILDANVEDERSEYDSKQGYHVKSQANDETESQKGYLDKTARDTEDDISSDEDDYPVYPQAPIQHVIIDCSPLNYVDTYGVKTLNTLISEYNTIGVKVFLAECNDAIRDRFECMQESLPLKDTQPYVSENIIHPSVHDAVLHAKKDMKNKKKQQVTTF